ncbi:MAG: hypothetical protein H7Z42_19085 [Roseiflexaceae bacterium]|nr:hypothetical protein [Roseiflexaceae bacterium]
MKRQAGSTQRVGRIYRFSVNGADYAAFIWQNGVQFRGRVEGQPQIPLCTARTAIAVRDALQQALVAQATT